MKYYLSAFRHTRHPAGHIMADKIAFDSIKDAMEWIYANMLKARTNTAAVRFDAVADREGITEMIAEYEGEWSLQEFDQLNDIESVIIQRADVAEKYDTHPK